MQQNDAELFLTLVQVQKKNCVVSSFCSTEGVKASFQLRLNTVSTPNGLQCHIRDEVSTSVK
jgi:hypothetical protein